MTYSGCPSHPERGGGSPARLCRWTCDSVTRDPAPAAADIESLGALPDDVGDIPLVDADGDRNLHALRLIGGSGPASATATSTATATTAAAATSTAAASTAATAADGALLFSGAFSEVVDAAGDPVQRHIVREVVSVLDMHALLVKQGLMPITVDLFDDLFNQVRAGFGIFEVNLLRDSEN